MTNVFSDEELSADDHVRRIYEPLSRRSWSFTRANISRAEPMEAEDFLDLFRVRLNITRQATWAHWKHSYHTLKIFEWDLNVMVHHGVHIGITSDSLSQSRLVLALRRFEKYAIYHRDTCHGFASFATDWDMVRSIARRIKRRLLKMSRENSRAVEGG